MTATVWSKFFWSDWSNDPLLRLCSLAAQGLWMRCLCVASEGTPTGHLTFKGRALGLPDIARLAGVPEAECAPLLAELEQNGVFSRTRTGAIYSRRMVRDRKKAAIARKNGEKGGNPNLRITLSKIKEKPASVKPPDKPPDKRADKPQKPEPTVHIPEIGGGGDALGWPLLNTTWVDELIAATGCAHPVGDFWPRITASVVVGWHEIDRFEWRDVVAGILAVMPTIRPGNPPKSWRYFASAIVRVRNARIQPTPEVSDAVPNSARGTAKRARNRAEQNEDTTIAAFERVFSADAPGQ